MTKDEIIRMAREVVEKELVAAAKTEVVFAEAYRCGYAAGAVAEREDCAKLCEDFTAIKRAAFNSASGRDPRFFLAMSTRKFCAKAIRARGNT